MDVKGKLTLTCNECGNDFEKEINITMMDIWKDENEMVMIFDSNIDFIHLYSGHIKCHSCIEKDRKEIEEKYGSFKNFCKSTMKDNLITEMKGKYGEMETWDSDRKEYYETKCEEIENMFKE